MAALALIVERGRHVVAQIIEAELVVGAVGDVGRIRSALFDRALFESGNNEAHFEAHPLVDSTHPLGVTPSEVIVHRDQVNALTTETVEIGRQGRHQGLAFAGLHFGDPAKVQRSAAHHLDVVVALADDAACSFAGHCECLDE